jgi:hypothetical protein
LTAEEPSLDLTECAQFLQFWMDVTCVGHVTLVAIIPDGNTAARTFARGDDRVGAWIAARQEAGCNLYFQPNETRHDCGKKPSKADMVAAISRFADIDPDDESFPFADEQVRLSRIAEQLVADPDFPPTVIIGSGNGMQPLWVVAREALTPIAITRIERETKAIEEVLGAGGTHNIDRLLRLPGTVNIPNKRKLRLGRGRSRARAIHMGSNIYTTAQAATLAVHLKASLNGTNLVLPKPAKASKEPPEDAGGSDIVALVEQLKDAGAEKVSNLENLPAPLKTRLQATLKARERLADRWAGLVDDLTERGMDDSRSGADFSLAAMLKAAGFNHFETGLILCAFQHGKVNGDDWPSLDAGLRYVARCALRSYNQKRRTERTEPAGHDFSDVSGFRLDIMTVGTPPPRRFLLEPLMPLGTVGLVIGPGGVGKSLTLLDLCIQVATPVSPGNGNREYPSGPLGGAIPADARGASLFLTLEDDRAEIHRRAVALDPGNTRSGLPCYVIPGLDLPDFDPVLVTAEGRVAALTEFAETGLDNLLFNIAVAAGHPIRLLVLDPAGDFLEVDENDAMYVKVLMRRLRVVAVRHGCTIILLGHVAKAMDMEGPSMRGSTAWVANSRFAYALWPPPVEEAQKLARRLRVGADQLVLGNLVKANHAGAPIGQKRLYLRDPDTGRLTDLTARVNPEGALNDDALLSLLVDACAQYAAAGMPYAYSGVAGLWAGRADLPEQFAHITKARLERLGTQALETGRLVKARTKHTQGAPKYLDLPDGPLARGLEVDMPHGSRREALDRTIAATRSATTDGTVEPPDGNGADIADGDGEAEISDKDDPE